MIISRVLFCFLIFYDSPLLFSIEWGGYTVNPFHQQDKQWFEDRRRRINDRIYGTEVKDRFLFSFSFFFFFLSSLPGRTVAGARREKGKERMHPSSVIHCPGCTPYVFPCRGALSR